MTKFTFLTLSVLLGIEILIGGGMLFGLREVPAVAVVQDEVEEVVFVEEEVKPASVPIVVESPPPPEPVPPPPPPEPIVISNIELTPQGQLANPPEIIKAVYLTSWSGGSRGRIDYVIQLAKTTEMNAVVVDIKDFSGEVAYKTDVLEVKQYGAEAVIKIRDIDALLERLHKEDIYVIARITVFQDPVLVKARPDLAVRSIESGGVWLDNKGLGWVDPAAKEAWNYTVAIAKDASSRGFDEINFDYIRFPSDGNLQDMQFPFSGQQTLKSVILRDFFKYLREHLEDTIISADLFGLSTSSRDDLGIGQVIEDAYEYFDYVCPMVYPSHYAQGYLGYLKPAEYPYEVVNYSMRSAQARLQTLQLANPEQQFAKLRPWLQDFDLGAPYGSIMVQAQVQAVLDALREEFTGFLLWASTNYYTTEALHSFVFPVAAYQARPRSTTPNP